VEIDLINHNEPHIKALKALGAHVIGTVDFIQPVQALLPSEMMGTYDIIFLMTKQLDNRKVVTGLVPFLSPAGVICTMQNGLPELSVSDIIGPGRTYGCAVGWGATMVGPGLCQLTSEPTPDALAFSVGSMSGHKDDKLDEIVRLLAKMGKVTVEENFLGARWAKLLVNSAFSGLSAVLGCTYGEAAADKTSRLVAQRVIKECIEVANGAHIRIEPIQGKDIVKLLDYHGSLKQKISFMIIPIAIRKHRLLKAGMLQDLEKGKKCEIEGINGVVCEYGDKVGIETPYNDQIVAIVKDIEAKKYPSGWDNLKMFAELNQERR
jgi:2-dehydropantoate 2-reductase